MSRDHLVLDARVTQFEVIGKVTQFNQHAEADIL